MILADVVIRLRKPRRPQGPDPEANSINLNQTASEIKTRNRRSPDQSLYGPDQRQAEDYLASGEDNSDENNMGSGEDNSGEFNIFILHGIRRT